MSTDAGRDDTRRRGSGKLEVWVLEEDRPPQAAGGARSATDEGVASERGSATVRAARPASASAVGGQGAWLVVCNVDSALVQALQCTGERT